MKDYDASNNVYDYLSVHEVNENDERIGTAWGTCLAANTTLIHLDMSSNNFSELACNYMNEKLKDNHTLYGLHMAGNACYVDS